jgi:membrane-bound ClpP family serine protease
LAIFIVGTVLAALFSALENLPRNASVALPRPELARLRRQVTIAHLGGGLAGFGLVGMVLAAWARWEVTTTLPAALAGGFLAWALAHAVLRLPCSPALLQQRAVVVREIPPGGFGQVKVQAGEREALLAAQSQEEEGIPAGAEVEVVDCQRSVVVVRRLSRP